MQPQYITLGRDAKNIMNQRFGRLVALGPIARDASRNIRWRCLCDCGNIKDVLSGNLISGQVKSCGCLSKEVATRESTTHSLRDDPLYDTWEHIIQRCTNPNNSAFARYGGRGITICDEWRYDFKAFHDYVSGLPHYGEKGYSLDRTNNSLGYSPGNLRLATATEQNRNQRKNIMITHNGKTQCVAAWAEEVGMTYATLYLRLRRGWSTERALSTPQRSALSPISP